MRKQLYDKKNLSAPLFLTKGLKLEERERQKEKKALIEDNLSIVSFTAKKYTGKAAEFDDLVSVGSIGLIKAANSFDPLKNVQFSTYASHCIKNEILMYLRKNMTPEIPLEEWKEEAFFGSEEDLVWVEMERKINRGNLKEIAERLPPRQKKIIYLRFGLDGEPEQSQKNVAAITGVSQSCVSKVERKFIKLLKADMADDVK